MQYNAGMLDRAIARQIFLTAANDKIYRDAATSKVTRDLPSLALNALYSACADNIHAISAVTDNIDLNMLPTTVSTVISATTLEAYCIKSEPAFRAELIKILTKLGSPTPKKGFGLTAVFAELAKIGITDVSNLPGVRNPALKYVTLKSRYARFWLAGDPAGLPSDPHEVRDLFGLGSLKAGEWLIRVTMPRTAMLVLLGANTTMIRRPSAFCVNDSIEPRFRGLTPDEFATSKKINPQGTTAHLGHLESGARPANGADEWICPQVALAGTDIRFVLLGEITKPRTVPDNDIFAEYLEREFCLSSSTEKNIIKKLAA